MTKHEERAMLREIARLSQENAALRLARGVQQPVVEFVRPTRAARVAPKAPKFVTQEAFTVKAESALPILGEVEHIHFTGTLAVGALRPRKQGAGMTRDVVLTLGAGDATFDTALTMNDGQLARLKAQGTRVYLGGRCYLLTLEH
jgi:hypothetical protein